MSAGLARIWWAIGLRGLATLHFGVAVLALLFATYVAADGVFAILTGTRAAGCRERWWPLDRRGHDEPRRGGRRARPVGAGRGPRGRRGQRPGNRDRRLGDGGGVAAHRPARPSAP